MSGVRLFLVFLLALVGCTDQAPRLRFASPVDPPHIAVPERVPVTLPAPAREARQAIVLLTIDGVRWQEVFRGVDRRLASEHGLAADRVTGPSELVPELTALASGEGAAIGAPDYGAPLGASDDAVKSLPGYMEIMTGRPATDCVTNHCPPIRATTVIDQLAASSGTRPGDVAVIASWPTIANAAAADPSRIVLSAGRHGGSHLDALRYDATATKLLEDGARAGHGPGLGDYRPDSHTAAIALRYLQVQKPRFLFIGLGDTDEWGHKNRYGRYLSSLHRADAVVGKVVSILASLHQRGWSTALFVTADHGRDPACVNHGGVASAKRSWLVAAGSLIGAHGFVRAPAPRHLADIAPTIRRFAGLAPDRDPRAGHVLEELLQPQDDGPVAQLEAD